MWIDISTPLKNGMPHWPGDPEFAAERVRSIERGDDYNLTALRTSAHIGTHVDAPLHFLRDGAAISDLPAGALIGPATVVDGIELPSHTEALVLFRCGAEIPPATARDLVTRRSRAVGIDSMSIGNEETHRILLGAGIWIIEGLKLAAVAPGRYELVCLPLLIEGADGAPARALLRALI